MTNDGDALFRALCEQPADDTARLVYADWLEENDHSERASISGFRAKRGTSAHVSHGHGSANAVVRVARRVGTIGTRSYRNCRARWATRNRVS